jgi:monoamine oxidase
VPKPSASIRSSWTADEFSLGADSFLPVGSSPDHRVALRQVVAGRVFFAGEATSSEHPGTVHGAQSSGTRAAVETAAAAQPGERIAVIGAGIAGATAAKYLIDAGFDVLVFE